MYTLYKYVLKVIIKDLKILKLIKTQKKPKAKVYVFNNWQMYSKMDFVLAKHCLVLPKALVSCVDRSG